MATEYSLYVGKGAQYRTQSVIIDVAILIQVRDTRGPSRVADQARGGAQLRRKTCDLSQRLLCINVLCDKRVCQKAGLSAQLTPFIESKQLDPSRFRGQFSAFFD